MLIVENVPEFSRWKLFPAWQHALGDLGYALSAQVIDSANIGVPQHRKRLFIIGTRSRSALWLRIPRREHVPARCIVSAKAPRWSSVSEKCRRTRERIAVGRRQWGNRFLVAYYGNEAGGRSLDRPLGTVTTRDRYALVEGDRLRMLQVDEYRQAMGFPAHYRLPENQTLAKHLLGNAVCPPVAQEVIAAVLAQ